MASCAATYSAALVTAQAAYHAAFALNSFLSHNQCYQLWGPFSMRAILHEGASAAAHSSICCPATLLFSKPATLGDLSQRHPLVQPAVRQTVVATYQAVCITDILALAVLTPSILQAFLSSLTRRLPSPA